MRFQFSNLVVRVLLARYMDYLDEYETKNPIVSEKYRLSAPDAFCFPQHAPHDQDNRRKRIIITPAPPMYLENMQ